MLVNKKELLDELFFVNDEKLIGSLFNLNGPLLRQISYMSYETVTQILDFTSSFENVSYTQTFWLKILASTKGKEEKVIATEEKAFHIFDKHDEYQKEKGFFLGDLSSLKSKV